MSTDELNALHRKLDDIHVALVGNPAMGHKGLVSRVDAAERSIAEHNGKLIRWGGMVAGATMALELVKDRWLGGGGGH